MGVRALLLCLALCVLPADALRPQPEDGITRLVFGVEQAIRDADATAFGSLLHPDATAASTRLDEFFRSLASPRPAVATVKERDRAADGPGHARLLLEILTVRDREANVTSWRVDIVPGAREGTWVLADAERLTTIDGLYRLALDTSVEYAVHDLVINAPDLTITVPSGYAYAAATPDGPTGYAIVGKAVATLSPAPAAERGQIKLFTGDDVFRSEVSGMFIRLNPADVSNRITQQSLTAVQPDPHRTRRAQQLFNLYAPKSFVLDLSDLSTDQWWLLPPGSDFLAELETPRYGSLTYSRSNGEAEDIAFFDRHRRRNIAVYASKDKLAIRGPFYSEDDRLDYDISRYALDVDFAPEREWVDGVATISIHTRTVLSAFTLRLAEPLVVRGITSRPYGRLLYLRVVGQNSVLVGFPGSVPSGTDVDVTVTYGGRLPPQGIDSEAIQLPPEQQSIKPEEIVVPPEPQYVYSNRTYWYPQGEVTEYATATMTVTAPAVYDVVATGTEQGAPQTLPAPAGQHPRKKFVFAASRPARYLSVLISRFQPSPPVALALLDGRKPLALTVTANPHEVPRVRSVTDKATDILRFYASVMG
ncbi:MAG TPA: hypothetical protein VH138_08640, partial [Vicinamibacterales bacterium]|nr:hypothetical protein [Vicinamibacterales bacterium]